MHSSIQTEIDASYLYGVLAAKEEDTDVAEIFRQMSEIEKSHALAFMAKYNIPSSPFPPPSGRAKTLEFIGKIMGYDYICLLYTSDAADERSSVDLGGRRIIKKKTNV